MCVLVILILKCYDYDLECLANYLFHTVNIYLDIIMSNHQNNTSRVTLREDMSNPRSVNLAKANLRSCSCLSLWKDFNQLSINGRLAELDIVRLRLCIDEQVWSQGDIMGLSLGARDRTEPYPDIVNQCLTNRLKNAKTLKKEAFQAICQQRTLFRENIKPVTNILRETSMWFLRLQGLM